MKTEETFELFVTQHLHPNNVEKKISTDFPIHLQEFYLDMLKHNCELHMEVLQTGEVAIYVSNNNEDLDIEVVSNNHEVLITIEKMLNQQMWLEENR